jgi:hypothetical protein
VRTALLAGSHRALGGWKKPTAPSRHPLAAPPLTPLPARAAVSRIPTAQDQGQVGDCAGQTGREVMTGIALRDGKGEELFSALYLYWWARSFDGSPADEDTGTYVETIFRVLAERGVPLKSTWDDDNAWQQQPSSMADLAAAQHMGLLAFALPNLLTIKASVVAGFPAAFGFDVPTQMMSDECAASGLVEFPADDSGWDGGGHAVSLWGYDDTLVIGKSTGAFLCLNHWPEGWGQSGKFWLPYDFFLTGHATDTHTLRMAAV